MTNYIVHLYRAMRLSYTDIEAASPQAAAAIARDGLTSDADNIDDCGGEDISALVEVAGDEDYSQSVTVDFEPERIRHAAARLLAALEACESQLGEYVLRWHHEHPGKCSVEIESAWEQARDAVAEAKTAGIPPAPAEPDIHALLAASRQIALIWSIEDVQHLRPDLDDDQAWEVLQDVDRHKDAELGISWLTLEMAADDLYGDAPEADAAGEA